VVLTCPFDRLLSDLTTAFARVTRQAPRARRPDPDNRSSGER
jgi:hypothetical protein